MADPAAPTVGGGAPSGPAAVPGSLMALALLAFFMADVRDGLGPFLATYLQKSQVQQELIGYTMTAGGLAGVAMTPLAGAWVDRSSAKRGKAAHPQHKMAQFQDDNLARSATESPGMPCNVLGGQNFEQ